MATFSYTHIQTHAKRPTYSLSDRQGLLRGGLSGHRGESLHLARAPGPGRGERCRPDRAKLAPQELSASPKGRALAVSSLRQGRPVPRLLCSSLGPLKVLEQESASRRALPLEEPQMTPQLHLWFQRPKAEACRVHTEPGQPPRGPPLPRGSEGPPQCISGTPGRAALCFTSGAVCREAPSSPHRQCPLHQPGPEHQALGAWITPRPSLKTLQGNQVPLLRG